MSEKKLCNACNHQQTEKESYPVWFKYVELLPKTNESICKFIKQKGGVPENPPNICGNCLEELFEQNFISEKEFEKEIQELEEKFKDEFGKFNEEKAKKELEKVSKEKKESIIPLTLTLPQIKITLFIEYWEERVW